jgi:hypothetical protein
MQKDIIGILDDLDSILTYNQVKEIRKYFKAKIMDKLPTEQFKAMKINCIDSEIVIKPIEYTNLFIKSKYTYKD